MKQYCEDPRVVGNRPADGKTLALLRRLLKRSRRFTIMLMGALACLAILALLLATAIGETAEGQVAKQTFQANCASLYEAPPDHGGKLWCRYHNASIDEYYQMLSRKSAEAKWDVFDRAGSYTAMDDTRVGQGFYRYMNYEPLVSILDSTLNENVRLWAHPLDNGHKLFNILLAEYYYNAPEDAPIRKRDYSELAASLGGGSVRLKDCELYDWVMNGYDQGCVTETTFTEMDDYYLFEVRPTEHAEPIEVLFRDYSYFDLWGEMTSREQVTGNSTTFRVMYAPCPDHDMTIQLDMKVFDSPWRLETVMKKGKTLLRVTCESEPEPGDYRLFVADQEGDATSPEAAKVLLTPENHYSMDYDFSTLLNLPSGDYEFAIGEVGQLASEIEGNWFSYSYDEKEKCASDPDDGRADDQYGNEREFRRLVSHSTLSPVDGSFDEIMDNISARYSAAGLKDDVVDGVVMALHYCPQDFREAFLYGFYEYYMRQGSGAVCQFIPPDTMNISTMSFLTSRTDRMICVIFHESGHALDYCVGSGGYCSVTDHFDAVLNAIAEDLWTITFDTLAEYQEEHRDSPVGRYSEDECTQLVSKIWNLHLFIGSKKLEQRDCKDLTEDEFEALEWIRKRLKEQMPIVLTDYSNADMRDVLCGWTGNKIKRIIGDFSHTARYFWDYSDNPPKRKSTLYTEAWAEYYAAIMLNSEGRIRINRQWFPNLCTLFEEQMRSIRDIYRDRMLGEYLAAAS